MACKPEAVLSFINRVYEFLSGRKLPEIHSPPPLSDYMPTLAAGPGYARQTAARIAQQESKQPGTLGLDERGQAANIQAALEEHERGLQADRASDAQRYGVTITRKGGSSGAMVAASGGGDEHDGQQGGVGAGAAATTVSVKDVQVRRIEEEAAAARMRAQKEMAATSSSSLSRGPGGGLVSSGGGGGYGIGRSGSPAMTTSVNSSVSDVNDQQRLQGGSGSRLSPGPAGMDGLASSPGGGGIGGGAYSAALGAMSGLGPGKVLEALNAVVLDAMSQQHHGGLAVMQRLQATGKPAAFGFVDLVGSGASSSAGISTEVAVEVLHGVQRAAPALAAACLGSPRGFHHVIAMLLPLIQSLSDDSQALVAATDAFVSLGICMCEHGQPQQQRPSSSHSAAPPGDGEVMAGQMYRDFALPQTLAMLKHRPTKRAPLLRIAYAFSGAASGRSSSGRLATIRALQEGLAGDTATFVNCLAITAGLDTNVDVSTTQSRRPTATCVDWLASPAVDLSTSDRRHHSAHVVDDDGMLLTAAIIACSCVRLIPSSKRGCELCHRWTPLQPPHPPLSHIPLHPLQHVNAGPTGRPVCVLLHHRLRIHATRHACSWRGHPGCAR